MLGNMYAVPGPLSHFISLFVSSLLCRAIVLQRDGHNKNPNFYGNLQCFAASLPIRLPKTHLQSYPRAGWLFKGEFFALGARGWLVGRHGLGIAMRTRMWVGTPASDPVLVWRPTLWSVE